MTGPEWRERNMNVQQPFSNRTAPVLPVVIKPLVYCAFRVAEQAEYGQEAGVVMCAVFASEVIEEMPFCYQHGLVIQAALESEGSG